MFPESSKESLHENRPMVSITISVPADVEDSMKKIALLRGFNEYQAMLKSYINEGLRKDEYRYSGISMARFIEALEEYGVPDTVIQQATRDLIEP